MISLHSISTVNSIQIPPFNKVEMFAVKTLEGRITLDGHILKEFKNGEVFVQELTKEQMPHAYKRFGLKKQIKSTS